jgi:hypothetical protein
MRWLWPQTMAFVGVLELCLRVMRLPPFPRPFLFQKQDSSRGLSLSSSSLHRYFGPLGRPLGTGAFRLRLIASAIPLKAAKEDLSCSAVRYPWVPSPIPRGSPAGALPRRDLSLALGPATRRPPDLPWRDLHPRANSSFSGRAIRGVCGREAVGRNYVRDSGWRSFT